jgi:hypothetical protein
MRGFFAEFGALIAFAEIGDRWHALSIGTPPHDHPNCLNLQKMEKT